EPDQEGLSPTVLRPGVVIGGVHREFFVLLDGVVIQRQALAPGALRAGQRIRKSVQRSVVGGKNQSVIKQRWIFRPATNHSALPQLQGATPLYAPIRIQIKNQI